MPRWGEDPKTSMAKEFEHAHMPADDLLKKLGRRLDTRTLSSSPAAANRWP
jgi:hypothetical protein